MLDQFEQQASPNGHEAETTEAPPTPQRSAHIDPSRGVFITSRGNEVELSGKRISALMLERLSNDGKPKIPMVEVTLMGKHKQLEANPDDPKYKALLEEWETESRSKAVRYVYVMGVKGDASEDFIAEQREFFPNATASDWKYLWVCSLVPDEDIDVFIEAVIGQMLPTTKGMEDAAGKF